MFVINWVLMVHHSILSFSVRLLIFSKSPQLAVWTFSQSRPQPQ